MNIYEFQTESLPIFELSYSCLTAGRDLLSSASVQLRDHPMMTRKSGFKTWPPLWTTTLLDKNDKPTGEIGTLEQVLMHELLDNKIFLFIQFQTVRYMGFMSFDDARFCSEMYTLLKSKAGLSIKEIGDVDLSYTL